MEKVIEYHQKAYNLLIKEVEKVARLHLIEHNLGEFVMGNGIYFFTNQQGGSLHDEVCKDLEQIIDDWDSAYKLTGEPMRFTGTGGVKTDW